MGFKFLVWNVKTFENENAARTRRISEVIYRNNPDVFGIIEFKAKESARSLVTDYFPDYDFAFTDSEKEIEILVGWRHGFFKQAIFTQRRDLQASRHLRPGGLISLQERGDRQFCNILFLHLDSGSTQRDYDNRQEMYQKIWDMNFALKKLSIQDKESRLIVLGDFNIMGLTKEENNDVKVIVSAKKEISQLKKDIKKNKMRLLKKSYNLTWKTTRKKYVDSDIDHVITSKDVKFVTGKNPGSSTRWNIKVDGWNNEEGEKARRRWARQYSDHSPLIGEVKS